LFNFIAVKCFSVQLAYLMPEAASTTSVTAIWQSLHYHITHEVSIREDTVLNYVVMQWLIRTSHFSAAELVCLWTALIFSVLKKCLFYLSNIVLFLFFSYFTNKFLFLIYFPETVFIVVLVYFCG